MRIPDLILLFFVVLTFALQQDWKRVGLCVLIGTMTGDVSGALVFAAFYHWYPNVILWAGHAMSLGAFAGGVYAWLRPARPKARPNRANSQ
jgi:hypothetical protein